MSNTKNTIQNTSLALFCFFLGILAIDISESLQYGAFKQLFGFIGIGAFTLAVFLMVKGPGTTYNTPSSEN